MVAAMLVGMVAWMRRTAWPRSQLDQPAAVATAAASPPRSPGCP